MTIREFERAFKDWVNITCLKQMSVGPDDAALWAAKWMAERCHDIVKSSVTEVDAMRKIRQLAKELSNDH